MIEFDGDKFAEHLKTIREYVGYNQRQLSKVTGVHYSIISRAERGQVPNASNLLALLVWMKSDIRRYAVYKTDSQESETGL
jgi:transcriptional regulator with XRE-family HTH domain